MSHWGSEQGGSERSEGLGVLCEKSAGQRARQKRLRLHSVCWWCVRLRSHKRTTFPPPSFSGVLRYRRRIYIFIYIYLSKRRETICLSVIAGSVKLRTWRRASLDRVFLPLLLSPSLLLVERGAVWGWRYNPEQRSLEARNERVEASFVIIFEIRPNASVRPTIVHRLLVFFDEAFGTEKGGKRTKKINAKTHKSAATMFPQNRPPVSKLATM